MGLRVHSLSIKTRLLMLIVIAMLAMIITSGFGLMAEKSTLLEDRKLKTRHLVEAAYGVLAHFQELQTKGEMTEAAAKDAAMQTLKAMRYEKTEYFWVNDFTTPVPKMIMHAAVPALDGKVLDSDKFNCATSLQAGLDGAIEPTDGKKNLFVAFNEVATKAGHGFVTYNWPKAKASGGTTEELFPKLSYVKKFDGWNWLIGSGIYIDDVDAIFWKNVTVQLTIVGIVTALMAILLSILSRQISRPLRELSDTMNSIQTTQDLSRQVIVRGEDEIGAIGHSFNAMIKSFQAIIQQVADSVREVASDAHGLSQVSQRVAVSTNQQSDAAASMAASVEQMSVSIDHVAENSRETYAAAQQAGELSTKGSEIVHSSAAEMLKIADSVNHSTQVMQTLGEQSNQISAIVNAIKEIADQTNLLALNAAIEAARAGEQGRGFAVVADEVRKLAERTTKATVEIGTMIGAIQSGTQSAVASMDEGASKVRGGVELANQAGDSMHRINQGAGQVIAAVSEITNALGEQSAAAGQLAVSVERIARMSEQNSVEVGEIASTAERLEQLASSLAGAVGKFKT